MAKVISDEKMKLEVIINGNQAQKELLELEKTTRKYTEENKLLLLEKKRIEKQLGKESAEYKRVSLSIKENNLAITANKAKMKELQSQIGLTGLSMKQLGNEARRLKFELSNAIPGSEMYKKHQADLNAVTARMDQLRGKAVGTRASINSLADGFNRYAAIGASVIAVLTGVVLSIQKMIDYNGKLSDAQSNVMKTTRMNKKEVDELTKSFGLFQTRTQRIDLLKIAEEGGRIGIVKEEIGGFVEVMNKATVALGDSFTGGVSEVAEKLGKLKFLFKETKDLGVDEAYNSIGSAINELGADGVASERNIAEFATRVGSLPDALKPTIQNALALGAAFEESGVEAEVSGRAYNIFLKQASTNTKKFGEVMKISQSEVERLINKDPMEFFLKFSEGMKGLDAVDTAKVLDYLGINADGANKAIGAVANNIGRFRSQLQLSNEAFADGTSLLDEYEIKNTNFAATLEKIKKTVTGWFSSETFVKWLTVSFEWLSKFIGASEDASGTVEGFRNKLVFFLKVLAVVITSYISYQTAIRLTTVLTKSIALAQTLYNVVMTRGAVASGILRSGQILLAAIYNLVTGNITRASAAMRLFNIVSKANPVGILLSLLAGLATAFFVFKSKADESAKALRGVNSETKLASEINAEFSKKFAQSAAELKRKIEPLIAILEDQNVSLSTRKRAYEELIKIAPEFKGTVDDEFRATNKLREAYSKLLVKMQEKLKFQSQQAVLQKYYDEEATLMDKLFMARKKIEDINQKYSNPRKDYYVGFYRDRNDELDEARAEYRALQGEYNIASENMKYVESYRKKQIDSLTAQQKKYEENSKEWLAIQAKINALIGESFVEEAAPNSNYKVPEGNDKKGHSKKYDDSYLNEQKKLADELLKRNRENEENRLKLIKESYVREAQLELVNFNQKLEDIQIRNNEILEFEKKLTKDLETAEKSNDTAKIASIKIQQQSLSDIKKALKTDEEHQEQMHYGRMGILQEKAANDEIKTDQENFERAKLLRETKHNEALAALGNNKKAREKLQKEFDLNEIEEQEKHLRALIDKFNLIVGKGEFKNFDLSLLTPEQVQYFTDEAAKLKMTLSELIDSKNKLSGNSASDELSALGLGGKTDILGFTPENWQTFFSNLELGKFGINKMAFAVQGLTNLYAQYAAFLSANEQAQFQRFEKNAEGKKTKLKRQLDSGYISQFMYNKQVERIDKELANKKADIDYKQAKRQRLISAANIINSTAQSIMSIWAQVPKFDFGVSAGLLTAMVTGLGALQLATTLATPLPSKGYEKGLYPDYVNVKREQDGKQFRPKYAGKLKSGLVSQNSLMVAEGNRPEMVIDNKAWSRISPEVQDALIREIRGVKGFEKGYYKDNVMYSGNTPTQSEPSNNNSDAMLQMMMSVVAENTQVMRELRDKQFEAIVDPDKARSMRNLQKGLKRVDDIKQKAKK